MAERKERGGGAYRRIEQIGMTLRVDFIFMEEKTCKSD